MDRATPRNLAQSTLSMQSVGTTAPATTTANTTAAAGGDETPGTANHRSGKIRQMMAQPVSILFFL